MSMLDLPEITFSSPYSKSVTVEITAKQITDPLPGPGGLHVVWSLSRGLAVVEPSIGIFVAHHPFVVIFEGRESGGSGNVWYCAEASDVQSNNRLLMGTGKTARESFDNFCERAATLISSSPEARTQAANYGDDTLVGAMREQAARCFKVRE